MHLCHAVIDPLPRSPGMMYPFIADGYVCPFPVAEMIDQHELLAKSLSKDSPVAAFPALAAQHKAMQ